MCITAISCTAGFVLDYDPLAHCSELMDIPYHSVLAFLNCFDKLFGQMGVMFCLDDIMSNNMLAKLLGATLLINRWNVGANVASSTCFLALVMYKQ